LIGGRLDFLNGRPVAALVYQRSKHIINLFVWPSEVESNLRQSTTNTGYNTFHWSQSGFMFWAVSDLNSDELRTFISLFQKNF
jgi:anti-sigma factor RsiW